MLSFLNEPATSSSGQLISSRYKRILGLQKENCQRVVHHYRRSEYSLPSDHLLVRLLDSLPAMTDPNAIVAYRGIVEDQTDALTRAFELSSPVNIGKAQFPGVFLGYDSEEILIATTENFNLSEMARRWDEAQPIRFLRHPKTDLNMEPLWGTGYGGESGPSVVTINIPMLACQYKLWQLWEAKNNPENPRNSRQFLTKFALSNALYSFQDVAYLNIVRRRYYKVEPSDIEDNHPFYLNTYYNDTIEGVDDTLEQYRNQDYGFIAFMNEMQGINVPSLRNIVELPPMARTQQVVWSLVIARLPVIVWMIDWNQTGRGDRDRQETNEIRRMNRRLRSERVLDTLVSEEVADKISSALKIDVKERL